MLLGSWAIRPNSEPSEQAERQMFLATRDLPSRTSSCDRHSARSAAEPHCLSAIAKIQIEATAAYSRSSIHHRVRSVVSNVKTSQPDHGTKWQNVRVGRNDALGDSRPCCCGFARAICGDGEGHWLGK